MSTVSNGMFQFQSPCRHCGGQGKTIDSPCPTCRGRGQTKGQRQVKVKVPAGVDNGTNIRLAGQGAAGRNRAQSGNLYIQVKVKEHAFFVREGPNIHVDVPLSLGTAVLGGTVRVPTLEVGGD